jgi:hypothetical protein
MTMILKEWEHHVRDERRTREALFKKHGRPIYDDVELPPGFGTSWCGDENASLGNTRFVYLDATHALNSIASGSCDQPCRECLKALRALINSILESGGHAGEDGEAWSVQAASGPPTIDVATSCPEVRVRGDEHPSPAWLAIGLMRQAQSGFRIKTSVARTRATLTELLRRGWVKVAVDAAGGDFALVALTDGGTEALAWAEELLLDLAEAAVVPLESRPLERGEVDGFRLTETALHTRGRSAGVDGRLSDGGLVGSSAYCAGYVVGSNARLGALGARARGTLEDFARGSTARHRAEAVAAALSFVDGGPPLEGHYEVALRALLESSRNRGWRDDLRDLLAVVSFKMRGAR